MPLPKSSPEARNRRADLGFLIARGKRSRKDRNMLERKTSRVRDVALRGL